MSAINNKPATVNDMQKIVFKSVSEATDAILDGMQKMFDAQDKKIDSNSKKIDKNSKQLDRLHTEFKFMRDDIKGLEGEFASTVSRAEFSTLKSRVDKYHPIS